MKKYYAPDFAHHVQTPMPTRGKYAKGFALGAVIHYTAGRDGAEKTIMGGIKNGYTYWCIQKDGKLFAAHDADKWGYHCGESTWQKFISKLKGNLSDDLLGIEINNAGMLKKQTDGTFKSWYGETIPKENVRYVDGKSPDQAPGYYEKYTPAQEETLIQTILWLKAQRPEIFDLDCVLGHCEISGKLALGKWRKVDPGGSLSCSMPEFRKILKERWERIK